MAVLPLKGRPAHAPGPTFLSYTPDGDKLVTAGLNNAVRVFKHGSDGEPTTIDVSTENHFAAAAANGFFVLACEDGDVTKYSLTTYKMEAILTRCSAPVRDLVISPDSQWIAVASDELEIKVVNTQEMEKVVYLREQSRPARQVSWDTSGSVLTASCTDGMIYVYSFSSEQPQLVKRIDGLIPLVDLDSDVAIRAMWHPDGRAFAVPTQTRDLQVVARNDWQRQKVFAGGHKSDITSVAWSPNGALLVTTGEDKELVLWNASTQKIIKTYSDLRNTVLDMQWHPKENVVSYTNNNGELFIRENFVPEEYRDLLRMGMQPAPLNTDPLSEVSGNARKPTTNDMNRNKRSAQDDYLDELLGPDAMSEDGDNFIEDDDGAGYAEMPNKFGKRPASVLDGTRPKRQAGYGTWQPQLHDSFQPSSTPWKGNRRYLCLNLIGFVWTIDQETHHTVTVEFYDRQRFRDFHFTDPYRYDKACLNEKGTLFSCPASAHHPSTIYYRPHEIWTTRADWRTQLPAGEEVTSLSLSDSCVVCTTTAGYIRIYSLFGLALKVRRQKSMPAVTCTSWRDYVMTVGNGPVGSNGTTQLLYTIENVKRDEICQNEDILALPEGTKLRSIFFSDKGDPCIYDSDGVLLILQHWRTPGQAKWVPLLDTKALDRLSGGRKEENYWPVTVAGGRFHCIILKGGEQYPYFPRPLLSELELKIPIFGPTNEEEDVEVQRNRNHEEQYVRNSVELSCQRHLVENTNATSTQKTEVSRLEGEVNKALLQLIAAECREGEERGMKALEIATLLRDDTGRMLEAAGKIAQRFQRDLLGEKITELAERRLVGLVDDYDV